MFGIYKTTPQKDWGASDAGGPDVQSLKGKLGCGRASMPAEVSETVSDFVEVGLYRSKTIRVSNHGVRVVFQHNGVGHFFTSL